MSSPLQSLSDKQRAELLLISYFGKKLQLSLVSRLGVGFLAEYSKDRVRVVKQLLVSRPHISSDP